MFSRIAVATFFASALLAARADPNPSEPGPGDVFNQGASCPIAWDADASGTWKEMYIELMTGDNFNMVHLTTVAKVDGTDASNASLTWTCPEVTPNSAIYFYQFRSPASSTTYWTTRFAIASASGQTTTPTNATQPGTGDAIPWGTGAFVDPTLATAAPDLSSSSNSTTVSSGVTTTATGSGSGSGSGGVASTTASSSSASIAATESGAVSTVPHFSSTAGASGAGSASASGSGASPSTTADASAAGRAGISMLALGGTSALAFALLAL
ncbi:hypothetical protein PUNSTDRAFT_54488 [Punctularia strigosozonata HHB-11173 SS5]|uniref:uncharacterized protein n=1 Tax=Punctularia strigosozonata (strain HHB-11173) TaxID=741275 RepID=UPI0004416D11|nr:uncharacterized protein PUNSTDRAFT_54488 [Punctularia strigosozonata HHB-11173 SS5]EIN06229.1 hypothetical protein PUNSTDRAFT_54488 [Punctularia strigosozonata HHB-11173 SS5]